MPKATDGRKPVGTIYCEDCDSVASFYQVQKGNRKGYLYRRCGCGADQSVGIVKQKRWLNEMEPIGEMIPHPLALEPDPREEKPEPEHVEHDPEPSTGKGLAGLLLLAAAGVAAFVFS